MQEVNEFKSVEINDSDFRLVQVDKKIHDTKFDTKPTTFLKDALKRFTKNKSSVIYKHHIEYVKRCNKFYSGPDYEEEEPNQIVVDYIASMTDDYMIELYSLLFPDEPNVEYVSYFKDL